MFRHRFPARVSVLICAARNRRPHTGMIGSFASAPAPSSRSIVDAGMLTYRDRAALRILYRADVATTSQLTTLVYHRRQTAQERLAALYRAGYLERAILPPASRGGAPFAFRVSPRGRRRLHYAKLTRGRAGTQLRHSLNGVETVCALLDAQPPAATEPLVTAWLTETMAHDTLRGVYPDGIVVLQGASGSAVVCLEIDEATEPGPVIADKLERYEKALWSIQGVTRARVSRGPKNDLSISRFELVAILRDALARAHQDEDSEFFRPRPEERCPSRAARLEGRPQWTRFCPWPSFETLPGLKSGNRPSPRAPPTEIRQVFGAAAVRPAEQQANVGRTGIPWRAYGRSIRARAAFS